MQFGTALTDYVAKRLAFMKVCEGVRQKAYYDSVGKPSIGIGFNLAHEPDARQAVYSIFGLTDETDPVRAYRNQLDALFTTEVVGGNNAALRAQVDNVLRAFTGASRTNESAGQGTDTVNSAVTRALANNIECLFLTGTAGNGGTGNTLANLLRGNTGSNTLAGAGGNDILEGGDGNDTLSNTSGNSLYYGGDGTDTITGTGANELFIGGAGDDALTTGAGADIIVFNSGGGQDTVAVSTTQDNIVALGGGVLYADLLFQKIGNDLVLKVGATDQVTFTGYYASASNRSVDRLQVVIEGTSDYDSGSGDALRNKKLGTFDFDGLVTAFDTARALDPGLTTWALTNALLAQHLGGSDTAAYGGDLAYRYGRFGNLGDISFNPAVGILGAAGFGTTQQTLQSLGSLQDATPRLS